jgi:hypothetical protein
MSGDVLWQRKCIMKNKFLRLLMMVTICSQVANAHVNVKWTNVNDKTMSTKFSAIKTYDGEIIKKVDIKGYENTIAKIMEQGQIETNTGKIVYAREIGSISIPTNIRINPYGKKPATVQ